uniref:Uncharacterized protein n=1 Tax=Parascaris equorum TaxID=6256 RepID=A0A914RKG9_PAREQ
MIIPQSRSRKPVSWERKRWKKRSHRRIAVARSRDQNQTRTVMKKSIRRTNENWLLNEKETRNVEKRKGRKESDRRSAIRRGIKGRSISMRRMPRIQELARRLTMMIRRGNWKRRSKKQTRNGMRLKKRSLR